MNKIFLAITIIEILILTIWGIWISHRIAGPLHRLCQFLKTNTGKAEIPLLKFRDHDFFPEVADEFNKFSKSRK